MRVEQNREIISDIVQNKPEMPLSGCRQGRKRLYQCDRNLCLKDIKLID